MITNLVTKFDSVKRLILDRKYYQVSYSQEGEDLMLQKLFGNKKNGFFIDVGAHHPKRFSNTYLFYKRGWRGINIDAMPGSMNLFHSIRNRDINLEAAIGNDNAELTYYIFNEPALNGFSRELSQERNDAGKYKIERTVPIRTQRLSEILEKNLPHGVKKIDFMSVDVEGFDLEVLMSNNWEKYRPTVLLVEALDFMDLDNDPIFLFLKEKKYRFYAKSHRTVFFLNEAEQI